MKIRLNQEATERLRQLAYPDRRRPEDEAAVLLEKILLCPTQNENMQRQEQTEGKKAA